MDNTKNNKTIKSIVYWHTTKQHSTLKFKLVCYRHILCGVKHPQTNGKLEKFYDLYNVHRSRFGCLDDFVCWYNGRPHGALNLWEAETPDMAFVKRL